MRKSQSKEDINGEFNWRVLLLLLSVNIVAGVYRDGFPSLFPFMQADYSLSRVEVSLYFSCVYFTATLVAVFSGRITDMWGSKKGMVVTLLVLGFFLFLHILPVSFIVILVLAVFSGFGISAVAPATGKGMAEWFSPRVRATAGGIIMTGWSIGGVLGSFFLPLLAIRFGWHKTVIFPSLLCFLVSGLIWSAYQDKNNNEKRRVKEVNEENSTVLEDILLLLRKRSFLLLCGLGVMLGSAMGIVSTHLIIFLHTDCGLDMTVAGFCLGINQVGSFVGRPLWGIANDQLFNNRIKKSFLIMGLTMSGISLLVGLTYRLFRSSLALIIIVSFVLGLTNRGWGGLYNATAISQVEEKYVGLALGIAFLFVRIGLMVAPPIFGYIADLRGNYGLSWIFFAVVASIIFIIIYQLFNREEVSISQEVESGI